MVNQSRLPALRATTPGQLFDWCFKVIDEMGISQVVRGGDLSKFIDTKLEFDEEDSNGRFRRAANVQLSPLEALSLANLCLYYMHTISGPFDYFIGFEMEDAYKREQETYLSDGLLMQYEGQTQKSIMPFQETKAIGIRRADKRLIEDIAIENINKKLAIRKNYPKLCGLILSILPEHSKIKYEDIVGACNISAYDVVLAMEYVGNDLRTCAVHNLSDLKKGKRPHSVPVFSPKLQYES